MKALSVAAAACALCSFGLSAQQRLSPYEIVSRLQESGHITGLMSEVVLHGCPPDDHGRAVLDAVANAPLPMTVVSELAVPWGLAYADCDYAPLEAWFERALDQVLLASDQAHASWFIDHMPVDISPRMRQSLWQATASRHRQGRFHDVIAARAVRSSDLAERVSLTVTAIRDRPLTSEWIYGESGQLLREAPGMYLGALARMASSIPDERLSAVLGSVNGNVGAGTISADLPELNALRDSIGSRQELPLHSREPRRRR